MRRILFLCWFCLPIVACANPDALWNIVSKECVPNQKQHHTPDPCSEVAPDYAVLKDAHGPLQYLLLAVARVSGIEDPAILAENSPNYFLEAWTARSFMAKKFGADIPDADIALAINSASGRGQNQFHIHISCIRPNVRALIDENLKSLDQHWSAFSGGILGHSYFVRRITAAELEKNPFRLLANDLPEAKEHMKEFGLAMIATSGKEFILLADRVNFWKLDLASVEEIQDHQCPQVF